MVWVLAEDDDSVFMNISDIPGVKEGNKKAALEIDAASVGLKACPFCGEDGWIRAATSNGVMFFGHGFYVECRGHDCLLALGYYCECDYGEKGYFETAKEAAEKWNIRA